MASWYPPQLSAVYAVILGLLSTAGHAKDVDGCTSIAVSRHATVDGSGMVSHSNDCWDCDFRMVYVAAQDHSPNSLRPMYDAVRSQYPRMVDTSRSPQYAPALGIEKSDILGYIPQVPHTYALWESTYGLMNEHGLGMGESTCSAYLVGNGTQFLPAKHEATPFPRGIHRAGSALFTIGNLMAVALERCKTARCAIEMMGNLSMEYGFYGEDPGQEGAGEAATIVDSSGEVWVFHVLGGLQERRGANFAGKRGSLWAAQRVPDGHVAVIANNFIIRDVDVEDTENFITHPGLFDLAKEAGLWDGQLPFDFLTVLAPDVRYFAYNPAIPPIPLYTTLRMWGVWRQSSPSQNIGITDNARAYPFSVPVDRKVTHVEVMNWFRSYYEGTEFDMTLGALAGPFQTPNRAEGGMGQMLVPGQFARAMSIHRTSYTQVVQSGISYPKVWFAADQSASSVFVPFYSTVLKNGGHFDVETYGSGSMKEFSFTGGKMMNAWWAFDFVSNWMDTSYKNMSETYVYPKVQQKQAEIALAARKAEEEADVQGADVLASAQFEMQRNLVAEWWEFAAMLVVRYNDKFFNWPEHAPTTQAAIGYPAFWLEMIGYSKYPGYRPLWVEPTKAIPKLLLDSDKEAVGLQSDFDKKTLATGAEAVALETSAWDSSTGWAALLTVLLVSNFVSFRVGRLRGEASRAAECDGYEPMLS